MRDKHGLLKHKIMPICAWAVIVCVILLLCMARVPMCVFSHPYIKDASGTYLKQIPEELDVGPFDRVYAYVEWGSVDDIRDLITDRDAFLLYTVEKNTKVMSLRRKDIKLFKDSGYRVTHYVMRRGETCWNISMHEYRMLQDMDEDAGISILYHWNMTHEDYGGMTVYENCILKL